MAARRPFWKWHRWKSIGFCLWTPSTCIWNLKLKFQSKLDLCSGNHVVYRQTDGQTDRRTGWIQYTPPSNFVGRGYKNPKNDYMHDMGSTDPSLPGKYINIKNVVLPVLESHHKDKTVSRPSYLHNGNPYIVKDGLYIETGPRMIFNDPCLYNAWELQKCKNMFTFLKDSLVQNQSW